MRWLDAAGLDNQDLNYETVNDWTRETSLFEEGSSIFCFFVGVNNGTERELA